MTMPKPNKTEPAENADEKKRATKAEVIERREYLEELMIMNFRPAEIRDRMFAKYGMKESQVEKDITAVHEAWAAEKKPGLEKKRADQERRLLLYIRRADAIKDKARCEAVYAKIAGTEAPKKIAGGDGGPVKLVCEVVDYRADAPKVAGKK